MGEAADREFLVTIFTAPERRVVEDGGRHFLEAAALDNLGTPGEVATEARPLIPILNGVARLERRNHHDVEAGAAIQELGEDGNLRQHVVLQVPTIEVRAMLGVAAVKVGDEPPARPQPGSLPTDLMLRVALDDDDARKALRLWAEGPRTFPRLSNIVELVEARANIAAKGWASQEELKRFHRTANHPEAAGDDARHARARSEPPPKPMTPLEAEELVRRILAGWLRSLDDDAK